MASCLPNGDVRYKMEANPRGICLIINNQTFQKDKTKAEAKELKDRQGSDADKDALKATFEEMLFEVRCLDNLPEKKMLRTLNKLAEEDHSKFDCFACCVLSYGEPGVVFGSNGMPVKILSLTSALKKKNCPTLDGKPKVFFIHACPVVQAEPEDDHGEDVDTAATRITGAGQVAQGQESSGDSNDGDIKLYPKEPDFFLGYCTQPASVNSKKDVKGSGFIHTLTTLLDKHSSRKDIVEIMTMVNEEMTDKKDNAKTKEETTDNKPDPQAPKHSLRLKLRMGPCPKLKEVRLMVIGKSKRGKSSVANTVLGEDHFSVSSSFSQNIYSGWHQLTRDGRSIDITEMPTDLSSDEAARPLITITPGPHAIILCFRCEQFFTPEDYYAYTTLKKWLGSHFSKYVIIAVSGLDNIAGDGAEDMVRNSFVSILRELPSPDRFICLDNTANWDSRRQQGDKLLRLVDQVANDNGGGHFSNRKIRSFEQEMQYQLGRGKTRVEIKRRVVDGDDLEHVFAKRCSSCVVS